MLWLSIALLPLTLGAMPNPQGTTKAPAFTFLNQGYFHRYSKGTLHEFTPKGQTDLKKFTDMVTVNVYETVKDGEGLASAANSVLETYKANKAVVVKTSSVPRTKAAPAEHLVVVLFPRPDFIEASFTRFLQTKNAGASVVYSHRIYGAKVGDAMSKWLQKNGEKCEKALMALPKSIAERK